MKKQTAEARNRETHVKRNFKTLYFILLFKKNLFVCEREHAEGGTEDERI